MADSAERAARTFVQSYLACWLAAGAADYDELFTVTNLKAGVVGLALSLAVSVGAKKRGADDSASLLPADVDPPQDPPPLEADEDAKAFAAAKKATKGRTTKAPVKKAAPKPKKT